MCYYDNCCLKHHEGDTGDSNRVIATNVSVIRCVILWYSCCHSWWCMCKEYVYFEAKIEARLTSVYTLLLEILKIGVVVKSIQVVCQHLVAKCKLFLNWRWILIGQDCSLVAYSSLTVFVTMSDLWRRDALMLWKTSTTPSAFSLSNWE
jgi:hypothetical protein